MIQISLQDFGKRKIGLTLFSLLLLLFSSISFCHAAAYVPGSVNCGNYTGDAKAKCELKDNFTFDVSTNWNGTPDNTYHTTNSDGTMKYWFVSGCTNESILYTNLRCDGSVISDSTDSYYTNNPCGTNSNYTDDYIKSDDLDHDSNVNLPTQNFTVSASSSDVGRAMSSVRIEWQTNTSSSAPTTWSNGQTCSGGSCTICRQGTLCPGGYAVIPAADLSTLSDGSQNRLWFRVIMTDSNGLSLTVGGDNVTSDTTAWTTAKGIPLYQSKYYEFVICNPEKCDNNCTGNPPVVNTATVSNASCSTGTPYTFSWTLNQSGQSEYILNVYDADTHTAIYSADVVSVGSGTSFSATPASLYVGTGGLLQMNHNYTWEVRVRDNNSNANCKQWSAYKTGTPFTTCARCSKTAPTLSNTGASGPSQSLCGVADPSPYYGLGWTYNNMPSGAWQSQYNVTVRNASSHGQTGNSGTVNSGAYSLSNITGWVGYNTTYEYSVTGTVTDGQYCSWSVTSPYTNFTTTHTYPVPAIAGAVNQHFQDCSTAGTCHAVSDTVTFYGNTSTVGYGSTNYNWTLDGTGGGTASTAAWVFPTTGNHTAGLTVTDGDGHACSTSKTINLAGGVCAQGQPSFSTSLAGSPTSLCSGLNDAENAYTVSWNVPSGYSETSYIVTVKNSSGTVVGNTGWVAGSATSYKIPTAWITYAANYTWTVAINITDGAYCTWSITSNTGSFSVPGAYPNPSFTVQNGSSQDCTSSGTCQVGEQLYFAANSPNGGTSYTWSISGEANANGANLTRSYGDTNTRAVNVTVSNAYGTCSAIARNVTLRSTAPTCDSLTTSAVATYSPSNLCNGLNDTNGFYIASFSTDNVSYFQFAYTLTVRDANTHVNVASPRTWVSNSTFAAIPSSWITWGGHYEWSIYTSFTDGAGCTVTSAPSPWTSFTVPANPQSNVSVDLLNNTLDGDFCSSTTHFLLNWQVNNATQTGYTMDIVDLATNNHITSDSSLYPQPPFYSTSVTRHMVPSTVSSNYGHSYKWRVTVTTAGGCSTTTNSPWSDTVGKNFSPPATAYPTPIVTATSSGKNCLTSGQCNTGNPITFDASSSLNAGASPAYQWTFDSNPYSAAVNFSRTFSDKNHLVTLTVTNGALSCSTAAMPIVLGGDEAVKWNEIAP